MHNMDVKKQQENCLLALCSSAETQNHLGGTIHTYRSVNILYFGRQALSISCHRLCQHLPITYTSQFSVNGLCLDALMGSGKYGGIPNLNPEILQ